MVRVGQSFEKSALIYQHSRQREVAGGLDDLVRAERTDGVVVVWRPFTGLDHKELPGCRLLADREAQQGVLVALLTPSLTAPDGARPCSGPFWLGS